MPCPGRPYTPILDVPKEEIKEEKSKKQVSCWHCGQDDHYAWTCGNKYQDKHKLNLTWKLKVFQLYMLKRVLVLA